MPEDLSQKLVGLNPGAGQIQLLSSYNVKFALHM